MYRLFFLLFLLYSSYVSSQSCCENVDSKQTKLHMQQISQLELELLQGKILLREQKRALVMQNNKDKCIQKEQELENRQRLRRAQKCEKVRHQIEDINLRLRQGQTETQMVKLKNKLAEYKLELRNLCKNE